VKPDAFAPVERHTAFIKESRGKHYAAAVPFAVTLLGVYDQMHGTRLAAKAAEIFCALVRVACTADHKLTLAARLVQEEYLRLLRPYLSHTDNEAGERSAGGGARGGTNGKSTDAAPCSKCVGAYGLLELPFGAGEDEVRKVKTKSNRDLHPDGWANEGERGKRVAEEQLKGINGACDHLLRCRFSHEGSRGAA